MSDVTAAVVTLLDGVTAVTNIVASRIYQGVLPQNPRLPAIRVQRISQDEPMGQRGIVNHFRTRVQVDSVADGSDPIGDAQALDEAVHGDGAGSALVGYKGPAGDVEITAVVPIAVRENFDAEELKQYKVMRDVFVWWRP